MEGQVAGQEQAKAAVLGERHSLLSEHCVWYNSRCHLPKVLAFINGVLTNQPGASLVYNMPFRNVSLRLDRLQEQDSGSYRCSVNVQDSRGVNKGHSSKTIELNVLGE